MIAIEITLAAILLIIMLSNPTGRITEMFAYNFCKRIDVEICDEIEWRYYKKVKN
jgi:hypothetical protein